MCRAGVSGPCAQRTLTLTWALLQQHWKPRPPSPDQSLACTRRMYSPFSLNVAEVAARPVNFVYSGPLKSAVSTAVLSFANVTEPGPRNLLKEMLTAGVPGRVAPGITLASSATQTVSGSGFATVPVSAVDWPRGPCTNGPVDANPRNGGVLFVASLKGFISHSGSRLAGITVVIPFAVSVQVSFFVPKSFGTVTVNTPHCRRTRKCVGCP